MKNKIIEKIEKRKEDIKKFSVKKIGLFGSFLKGEGKRTSDIDFLVEFNEVSADNFFGLMFFLEELLKRKIDLIELKTLRKELNHIKKEVEYVKL